MMREALAITAPCTTDRPITAKTELRATVETRVTFAGIRTAADYRS